MEFVILLEDFLEKAAEDHRMHPAHISLYTALIFCWRQQQYQNPIDMRREDLMKRCKIVGRGTYQRCLKELAQAGYIKYQPSFNRFVNARIFIAQN